MIIVLVDETTSRVEYNAVRGNYMLLDLSGSISGKILTFPDEASFHEVFPSAPPFNNKGEAYWEHDVYAGVKALVLIGHSALQDNERELLDERFHGAWLSMYRSSIQGAISVVDYFLRNRLDHTVVFAPSCPALITASVTAYVAEANANECNGRIYNDPLFLLRDANNQLYFSFI